MKCKYCGKENVVQASYCVHCGKAFPEEEKKEAFAKTVWGKLQKLHELRVIADLSVITGNRIFRALFLLGLLLLGFLFSNNQGSQLRLLESPDYRLAYNDTAKEYYLFSDQEEIVLQLYLPGKPEGIRVYSLNEAGEVLQTEELSITEAPVLERESSSYRISGVYSDKEESLQLRIYSSELWPE